MTDGARARSAREQAPRELADLATFFASSPSRDIAATTIAARRVGPMTPARGPTYRTERARSPSTRTPTRSGERIRQVGDGSDRGANSTRHRTAGA